MATAATCTEATLAAFERIDPTAQDCTAARSLGKADFLALGGCGENEHVCGWIFCCADYDLTWFSTHEEDWDIVDLVRDFQEGTPAEALARLEGLGRAELRDVPAETWVQDVVEEPGGAPRQMTVELTRGLVAVPHETFAARLAPETWGTNLAHYLGGEVTVYERDDQDRAVRQIERMVLSAFPCDLDVPLANNDMTKVEVIDYRADGATVYWWVLHSDNGSTQADVGSVDFRAHGDEDTLVTFHSAHIVTVAGGLRIAPALLRPALASTFRDHVRRYAELVGD